MSIRKGILSYAPSYSSRAADNPFVLREGDEVVVVVLTPLVGWGYAVKVLIITLCALAPLYLAMIVPVWSVRLVLLIFPLGFGLIVAADWWAHQRRTVLRISRDRVLCEEPKRFQLARERHSLTEVESAQLCSIGDDIKLVLLRRDGSRTVLLHGPCEWGMETLERVAEAINQAALLEVSRRPAEEPAAATGRGRG